MVTERDARLLGIDSQKLRRLPGQTCAHTWIDVRVLQQRLTDVFAWLDERDLHVTGDILLRCPSLVVFLPVEQRGRREVFVPVA